MRRALLLIALAGCRQILGIEESRAVDAQPIDANDSEGIDAPDPKCFGTSTFTFCLPSAPTGNLSLTGTLDTTTCTTGTLTQMGTTQICVLAADSISAMGSFRAIGSLPLVLAATTSITISGGIDVSSSTFGSGPNANPVECVTANQSGGANINGGGGGAGGSFGSKGGDGGDGAGLGGTAPAALGTSSKLHGGCRGGTGGAGSGASAMGGDGGGALYLVSRGSLTITGVINASGRGGAGGTLAKGGGAGGGSGGMIVLYASTITATGTARVVANGGGGGGGANNNTAGTPGDDPDPTQPGSRANGGGPVNGGQGAAGPAAGANGNNSAGGGGGGGGGGGQIRILTATNPFQASQVSPMPILAP